MLSENQLHDAVKHILNSHGLSALKAVAEVVSEPIVLIDRDYKVLFFNRSAERFFKNLWNVDLQEGIDLIDSLVPDLSSALRLSIITVLSGMVEYNLGLRSVLDSQQVINEHIFTLVPMQDNPERKPWGICLLVTKPDKPKFR